MNRILLCIFVFLAIIPFSYGQDLNYSTIDENLISEIESSSNDWYDIYVILEDKVDFESIELQLQNQRASQSLRAKTVISALQQKAKSSQVKLLEDISKESGIQKNTVNSYWLANMVFMRANREALERLSNDPRIEFIGLDGELQLIESEDAAPAAAIPDGVEPGLEKINVRPMWELGYTGYGQLALVADTGIDPTHRAFGHRYRGNTNGDSEGWYRWADQEASPFQCGDHGTHVLGTVLGLDRLTNDTIGVAFDAQWMGAANLCGGGTQSNVGAFEWALNPDGDLDTVEDMADVINNSWRDPSVFYGECNSIYVDILEALEAAGVVVVFSAGNSGPDPQTITPPHNINFDIVNIFSIGALNGNDDKLEIADFSSRGPSVCGGEGSLLIKPEVSAPGVAVRSAVLENKYGFKSGTSMAAPHVSGSILVLRQAFPGLTSRELKLALYNTARDLGEPGEDNTYGMGIIDVFAAYNYLIDEGNTPSVPPSSANDMMAFDLITDRFECDAAITSDFVFYNNTTDTVLSLDLSFEIDGIQNEIISRQWQGRVPPFSFDTISIDIVNVAVGNHEISMEISNPNGKLDERFLNNKISKQVIVTANERLETIVLEDQETCEGANMLIKADYSGDGTIQWFDDIFGGNLIGEGTQVVIEADEPKTIYGDILRESNLGKIFGNNDLLTLSNEREQGLFFDVLFPTRIIAFDFYSEMSGNFFIGVESATVNGDRDVIATELVRSDGSGWQKADVSLRVPEGFGYRLVYKDGIVEIGTTNSNIDYPYTEDDIMSVIGGVDLENSYPYFFNLKVEFLDFCGRVPVEISAVKADSLPSAFFETNIALIDLNDNQEINFFNTSENAISFFWDFDDGNFSTEENPVHFYEESGVYFPSLLVTNAEGCTDAFVQRVEVTATTSIFNPIKLENTFEIAPNPFSQRLNFKTDSPIEVSRVEIYNSAGIRMKTFKLNNRIDYHSEEIGDLISGLYYVLIYTENGIDTHKVIKH